MKTEHRSSLTGLQTRDGMLQIWDRNTLPMLPRVKATEGWFVRWWTARSWVACCVCTMQAWQEERVQAYIAGDACCFRNFEAVVDLLSPSAVDLQMPTEEKNKAMNQTEIQKRTRPMVLHKRRVTECMRCGKEQANLCHDCYHCLRKPRLEMPVNAASAFSEPEKAMRKQ